MIDLLQTVFFLVLAVAWLATVTRCRRLEKRVQKLERR